MSEMRDDLLATLGAAQEGADKTALADAFCDRWHKEARKGPRFRPPRGAALLHQMDKCWRCVRDMVDGGVGVWVHMDHAGIDPLIRACWTDR